MFYERRILLPLVTAAKLNVLANPERRSSFYPPLEGRWSDLEPTLSESFKMYFNFDENTLKSIRFANFS